jgi:hypothetical protein
MRATVIMALTLALAGCASPPENTIPGCTGRIVAWAICDDTGGLP